MSFRGMTNITIRCDLLAMPRLAVTDAHLAIYLKCPVTQEEPVSDEIFQAMRKSVIDGAPDTAAKLARESIDAGVNPLDAINLGYVHGITYVGEKFGCREMFLPDMLAAAEAMKAAVSVLEPEMKKQGSHREMLGKVVLGTAKGDIHDIGKNLVGTMLSASGFEVFDLGTNVPAEVFVTKAKAVDADIVGVSALLTTTMAGQKTVIEALEKEWAPFEGKGNHWRRGRHQQVGHRHRR